MSELLELLLAGMDQPQADHPNSLAGGLPVYLGNLIFRALQHAELFTNKKYFCRSLQRGASPKG
eukprot:949264-Pelagomonas_calceolata.AAC.1